jgi:hypothetical protein
MKRYADCWNLIKKGIVETEFNAVVTQDVINEDVTNQINDAEEEKCERSLKKRLLPCIVVV